jgi:hypothetical protein
MAANAMFPGMWQSLQAAGLLNPPLPPPRPKTPPSAAPAPTPPAAPPPAPTAASPPYEPGNAPDPNAPAPMEPYDPFGPVSGGTQPPYSGPPTAPMEPYDPFPASAGNGSGWQAGPGGQGGAYDPATVNALNAAFVASGLGGDQSGKGGIGSDWVSGGPIGTGGSWDPQGIAAKIASGSPDIPPYLAASNLNRYAQAFQNFGGFKNPNAGFAASTVAGAESGGNPFAVNQGGSGATGMNQWMNTPGNPRLTNMQTMTGGNMSPEMQGAFAASEIMGGGYGSTYNALNNPNASLTGMQGPLISNFEGLAGYPSQIAIDRNNAARYAQSQSSFITALRNNVTQNAGISP